MAAWMGSVGEDDCMWVDLENIDGPFFKFVSIWMKAGVIYNTRTSLFVWFWQ